MSSSQSSSDDSYSSTSDSGEEEEEELNSAPAQQQLNEDAEQDESHDEEEEWNMVPAQQRSSAPAQQPISRTKPSRLCTIGIGLEIGHKAVNTGPAYQAELPALDGHKPAQEPLHREPLQLLHADLEKEVAIATGRRLTAAAWCPAAWPPVRPKAKGQASDEFDVDELIVQQTAGATRIGGGRSSYVAKMHGALAVQKRAPGLLACELKKPKALPRFAPRLEAAGKSSATARAKAPKRAQKEAKKEAKREAKRAKREEECDADGPEERERRAMRKQARKEERALTTVARWLDELVHRAARTHVKILERDERLRREEERSRATIARCLDELVQRTARNHVRFIEREERQRREEERAHTTIARWLDELVHQTARNHVKGLEAKERREQEAERARAEEAEKKASLLRELKAYLVECGGKGKGELVDGFVLTKEDGDAEPSWCAPDGARFRSRVEIARHFKLIRERRGGERVRSKQYL